MSVVRYLAGCIQVELILVYIVVSQCGLRFDEGLMILGRIEFLLDNEIGFCQDCVYITILLLTLVSDVARLSS